MKHVPKEVLNKVGVKTSRQFRALKRKQIKAIKKAVDDYVFACAWCPEDGVNIGMLRTAIYKMQQLHKVANWEGKQPRAEQGSEVAK